MAFSTNVVAFYEMENNGNDSTANAYHCSAVGTPTYNTTYVRYGAYSLNGGTTTSNFLKPPSNIETVLGGLTSGGYTIQLWVRNNGNNNYSDFFAKRENVNQTGSILFRCNGTGGVYGTCVQLKWNSSADIIIKTLYNQQSDTQTWIRYNIEYDITNDQLKIYKNGMLGYTLPFAGNPFANNDGILKFGSSSFSNCDGQLDNCAFATTLMNGYEITELLGKAGVKYGFVCGGNEKVIVGGKI